jgi:hypothetical protein
VNCALAVRCTCSQRPKEKLLHATGSIRSSTHRLSQRDPVEALERCASLFPSLRRHSPGGARGSVIGLPVR